jgi:hypothetical protein
MGLMKKKIKDMTREEFKKMCDKYDSSCTGCPLSWMNDCFGLRDYLKAHEMEKALEQEIEVEDDEC